jgi:hypothetical protein
MITMSEQTLVTVSTTANFSPVLAHFVFETTNNNLVWRGREGAWRRLKDFVMTNLANFISYYFTWGGGFYRRAELCFFLPFLIQR